MDLSKLPKLSDTAANSPPPVGVEAKPVAPDQRVYRPMPHGPTGVGSDVWISLILGILFISMGSQFARFAATRFKGLPYHTGMLWPVLDPPDEKGGTEVAYYDLQNFTAYTETGEFLFGLTLIFDALAKTAAVLKPGFVSRGVLSLAVVATVSAVAINLYTASKFFSTNSGTPLVSLLIIAFGGYVLYDQINTLQLTRPTPVSTSKNPERGE